jgi:ATP synthase in type III secretion protein N
MSAEALDAAPSLGKALEDTVEYALRKVPRCVARGRVVSVTGQILRATGVTPQIGEVCRVLAAPGADPLMAEVVGFDRHQILLMPYRPITGLSPNAEVQPTGRRPEFTFGPDLLGRVVDGLGAPIDGQGPLRGRPRSFAHPPPDPMRRRPITRPLVTGVSAIDGLATLGAGQRVGIFAPAGVGKSTLLGMVARQASSDVNVIALIGERGREVTEFLSESLGPQGLARSVVVVATSDRCAAERLCAAYLATAIAEGFRDDGAEVLLMMDSLTRYARAHREVGLAAGEPPTRRGYPPSFFADLPRLLERCGQGEHGSITALYTVLVEGDGEVDPVAEEARSILDGHITLNRKLAQEGWFPAIDVLDSVSRVMPLITDRSHRDGATRVRALLSKHQDVQLLLQIGEFRPGGDALADEAVEKHERIRELLVQDTHAARDFDATLTRLRELASRGGPHPMPAA